MRASARPSRPLAAIAGLLLAGVVSGCSPSGSGAVAAAVGTSRPSAAEAASEPDPASSPVIIATPRPVPTPVVVPTPVATPSPSPTASPTPTPTATPVPTGPLKVNLYHRGDFVSQANKHQCVSAAMQIILNVINKGADRSVATQASLARLAKRLSDAKNGGTEPEGWARGLQQRGAGHYKVAVEATVGKAVRRAIEAIRATGRPVGLLVWRGAHSWVLHGFETTADPALTDAYKVTAIWVSDPWYPRISTIWGASRKPNQRITVNQLREDYLKWRRPTGRYPGKDGKYVLVIPVA